MQNDNPYRPAPEIDEKPNQALKCSNCQNGSPLIDTAILMGMLCVFALGLQTVLRQLGIVIPGPDGIDHLWCENELRDWIIRKMQGRWR